MASSSHIGGCRCGARHQENRQLVSCFFSQLDIGEAGIDLDQIAIRVFQPQFVQGRALPGGARRFFNVGAKSDCTVIGIDDGLVICHTDPQVIKRVLMQCFAIGDQ